MPISAGEQLGPYQTLAPIGKGGMGEVWRARDPRLGRDVAIKVSAQQFTDRFEREARAIAALNHPNICTLFDVGPNYLVMELIDGPTLADRIAQGPIPLEEALAIARQIADELEAAHEKGIVHRDLKPANIKIKLDGSVKVLDFGLAKSAEAMELTSDSPTMLSIAGTILGTAAYMAPEQARGKPTDKRADIFAFAIVLHEMVTGKRLFGGEDASEMLAKVIRDEPDLSDAPPRIHRLLTECLRKDPRKRLRDIGDVWRLLDDVSPVPAAVPATAAAPQRFQWLWPAAAAVLLLSTGALAFVHFRETPPVPAPMRFEISPPPKTTIDSFNLSPDGRKLVFSAGSQDGHRTLWLRAMDSLQTRELPGTQGAGLGITWSPDSQVIAFQSDGNLKKIDISGGTPQTLAPYSSPTAGISWSRQDVILFSSGGVLHRIPASGGEATPVTALDRNNEEVAVGLPVFLPDGKHFFYYRIFGKERSKSGIFIGSLDAKPAEQGQKRLLETPAGVGYMASARGGNLLFLRGETLMSQPFDAARLELNGSAVQVADRVSTNNTYFGLFSASNTGVLAYAATGGNSRQLTWFDRGGKVLGHVGEAAARDELSLSPDGTRVAEGRMDDNGAWVVWGLDLTRGVNTRLTFESGGAGNGTWSPDGSQIIYAPGGGLSPDLYRKPANGAGQGELLFHSTEAKEPLDWSRDGRFLLFAQLGKTGSDLWVLPMEGDRKPIPYLATPFDEGQGKFSPDGHWVVYTSNESGTKEVYVQPFPMSTGGKWPISNGGGSQPRWSRDGKELFYFTSDNTLMAVSVTANGSTFQPGVPKPLFRAAVLGGAGSGAGQAWRWDVSPDGQRFLINTALEETAASPVTIVLNWQSTAK